MAGVQARPIDGDERSGNARAYAIPFRAPSMVRMTIICREGYGIGLSFQFRQQFPDGTPQCRMYHIPRDFRQRPKHETPLMHQRMRNFQIRFVDYFFPVEKDIQVDGSRPPFFSPLAAQGSPARSRVIGRATPAPATPCESPPPHSKMAANPAARRRLGFPAGSRLSSPRSPAFCANCSTAAAMFAARFTEIWRRRAMIRRDRLACSHDHSNRHNPNCLTKPCLFCGLGRRPSIRGSRSLFSAKIAVSQIP